MSQYSAVQVGSGLPDLGRLLPSQSSPSGNENNYSQSAAYNTPASGIIGLILFHDFIVLDEIKSGGLNLICIGIRKTQLKLFLHSIGQDDQLVQKCINDVTIAGISQHPTKFQLLNLKKLLGAISSAKNPITVDKIPSLYKSVIRIPYHNLSFNMHLDEIQNQISIIGHANQNRTASHLLQLISVFSMRDFNTPIDFCDSTVFVIRSSTKLSDKQKEDALIKLQTIINTGADLYLQEIEFADFTLAEFYRQGYLTSEKDMAMAIAQYMSGIRELSSYGKFAGDIADDNLFVVKNDKGFHFMLGDIFSKKALLLNGRENMIKDTRFMAPWEFQQGKQFCRESDEYRLIAIFYHMITGEVPGDPRPLPSLTQQGIIDTVQKKIKYFEEKIKPGKIPFPDSSSPNLKKLLVPAFQEFLNPRRII